MVACIAAATGCNRVLGIEQKEASDAALAEPGFVLSIAQTTVRVVRGQSATVEVSVQRLGGFGGAVAIQASSVPPGGVTVNPVTIAPSDTTATLAVQASSSAPLGTVSLVVFAGSYGVGVSNEQQTVTLVLQDAPGTQDYTFGAPSMSGRVSVSLGTGDQGVGAGGLQVAPSGAIVICGHAQTDQAKSSVALAQLGADGTFDQTFGTSGIVLGNSAMSFADSCNAMFVRAGGGVTLAGFDTPGDAGTKDVMIARYRPGGLPDQNTDGGGYVTTPIDSPADSIAYGLLPGADMFFLASGAAARGAIVVRYAQHGEWDTTYGTNGVATVGPGQSTALWLASQSSGNVLVAVTSTTFRIVRLTPAGTIDPLFANNGVATAGDAAARTAAVLVDLKDRVFAVGTATGPSGFQDTAVVRLTESGEVDPSYGSGGLASAPFGGDSFVSAAVLQDDGAVVVAGQTRGQGFSVIRFSADGALDTAFGNGGRAPLDVNGAAQAIALDDLGRILVAGVAGADDASDGIVVYRLWP
jgi:uncharacterized delta-60 repeat protein